MNESHFFPFYIFLRQGTRTDRPSVTIEKDPRIDLLIKKQVQINEETTRDSRRSVPGYRIQVINSSDRNKCLALKQQFTRNIPS